MNGVEFTGKLTPSPACVDKESVLSVKIVSHSLKKSSREGLVRQLIAELHHSRVRNNCDVTDFTLASMEKVWKCILCLVIL